MLNISPRHFNQRERLYQQLGQMLGAGLPIVKALEALAKNPPTASFRQPLQQVIAKINQGATLAEAWQSLTILIPQFDIALITAGEKSGRLDQVFRLLANYYRERAALARQILSELAYPLFLFHFAIFVFPAIAWFQGKLTGVGLFLHFFLILAPIYGLALFLVFAAQGRRGEMIRYTIEKVCRFIPVLGTARKSLALARVSVALEALLNSGMNIIQAWELAAAASGSPALYRAVRGWRQYVEEGQTPAQVIQGTPREFPEIFANLYGTGEISGQLDDTLRRLHEYYQEEATNKFRLVSKIFTQLVYFTVAGFVVYKIISFYLDYFKQIEDASHASALHFARFLFT